jgi:uroporphyrinogen decarboxylase
MRLIVSSSSLTADHPLVTGATSGSSFLQAARGEPADRVPVWFMRQAGRSLPEYRELRAGGAMLDACFDADMVTEITLQPVRRHGVDAAILFSDIVVPLRAADVAVTIEPGVGPVMAEPVRDLAGVQAIGDLGDTAAIETAVTNLVSELGQTPLIGFCGAPFTVASYLVEGGPSREHAVTKALMWGNPELWDALLSRVADLCGEFLRRQVLAGASAIQVFDSWAGTLNRVDYEQSVRPYTQRLLSHIADLPVPRIHFGVVTGELLGSMALPECDVVGVDFRVDLADGIQPHRARTTACRATWTRPPCLSLRGRWSSEQAPQASSPPGSRRARPHLQPRARGACRSPTPRCSRRWSGGSTPKARVETCVNEAMSKTQPDGEWDGWTHERQPVTDDDVAMRDQVDPALRVVPEPRRPRDGGSWSSAAGIAGLVGGALPRRHWVPRRRWTSPCSRRSGRRRRQTDHRDHRWSHR